ncbi:hypothetical protein EOV40_008300 [Acetobacter oryzoeni]|uniref:Uncharacterized protein n=1 Tax=Acetobacter oryzoeni TaxID=2500548 RepID=A0A5B9GHS1_9PROT|nr:hypothetical protein EOV40_008300 [Acetobacter oryzoeni]
MLKIGLGKTNRQSCRTRAGTAYRLKANENFMEKQGFVSKVYRKKPHLKLNQGLFDLSRL